MFYTCCTERHLKHKQLETHVKAPEHRYPQIGVNTNWIVPVSFKNITVIGNDIENKDTQLCKG